MKKFLSLLFIMMVAIMSTMPSAANLLYSTRAEESTEEPPMQLYTATFEQSFAEEGIHITAVYTEKGVPDIEGEVNLSFNLEKNEESLEKFHKYCKKKIDSADIGFVFYPVTTITPSKEGDNLPDANYKYTVTLPKNLKNKELAVIPFTDYRTTGSTIQVKVSDQGTITFSGTEKIYAYAIVYNGIYKDLILIGAIVLVILLICVIVKVYSVRKDNPAVLEKKKEKGTKKAKEAHKQNRKLAQALKRQKEKEKKERLGK